MGYVLAVRANHAVTAGSGRTVTAAEAACLIPARAGQRMRTGSGTKGTRHWTPGPSRCPGDAATSTAPAKPIHAGTPTPKSHHIPTSHSYLPGNTSTGAALKTSAVCPTIRPEPIAEGNRCASHHRTRPCRWCRRAHAVRHPAPSRSRKRRDRARPRGRVHPGRAGLADHVDRPGWPRPNPERTRTRAVGCCHRAGLRHHRPDRGPAGVRAGRLDPRRVAGRVHRGGGPQPRPASGRHRPHRGRRLAHLRADRLAGACSTTPASRRARPS